MQSVKEIVLEAVRLEPGLSNATIAEIVRTKKPGARTTASGVASVLSRSKKDAPDGIADDEWERLMGELPEETDEERSTRIRRRFEALERMAKRVGDGELSALIVSGPPGIGKSYVVEKALSATRRRRGDDVDPRAYEVISGTMTAPGLLQALWSAKDGGVVVLDDCDDALRDEASLNVLKTVLDGGQRRVVSYRRRANWMAELGIPQTFEFDGAVVFCTNLDFERAASGGSALAPHVRALMDRAMYLSLTMRTKEDMLARLEQVAMEDGLLQDKGLSEREGLEVLGFVRENADEFHGLSLRLLEQVAFCYAASPETWREDVRATKMRTVGT